MEPVHIVITRPFSEPILRQLAAIDPRLRITDASALFAAERKGDATAREKLSALLAQAEIYCGLWPPQDLLERAPRLKWIQVTTAGVDRYVTPEYVAHPVVVTKGGGGTNATSVAEFTLALILMFAKQAPDLFDLKRKKEWRRPAFAYLPAQTVGIIGLGRIGRDVARLCKAFGMRTLGYDPKLAKPPRHVDELIAAGGLGRLLAGSDYVTLHCALLPETTGLIGEEALRSMKPGASLINLGRSQLVDQEAVVRALEERRLAGFCTDHLKVEPLPQEHRLWELPGAIILPIRSSMVQDGHAAEETLDLFSENLRRYLGGRRLLNRVNKKRGF